MAHGTIHLARLSTDPEVYLATFQAGGPRASQTSRTFTRLGEVDEFLQHAGIPGDHIRRALSDAREGGPASIPDVGLDDRALHDLGFVESSGAAKDPS